jgi:hypothetical protein
MSGPFLLYLWKLAAWTLIILFSEMSKFSPNIFFLEEQIFLKENIECSQITYMLQNENFKIN